jgi:diguanylate cyclase (GGDEF)-like protein/PAS domain S-box-containing protein
MGTLGEIFRWIGLSVLGLHRRISRLWARLVAWLLSRDQLVARTEKMFRALLESSPDSTVIADWHGHITLFNAQAERMYGWTRDEIVGQSVSELMPKEIRAEWRDRLKRYIRDPKPKKMGDVEMYGLRKNGEVFPVEISVGPLQTERGLLMSIAVRDVTDRRAAEDALKDAEERFRTAFEEAPVGMALAGLDGRLLQVNRAMCEITGHSREQLEATTFESITHPDDARRHAEEMQRLLEGHTTRYRAERRLIHASAQPVPVDLSIAVVRDAAGEPRHILAQMHDITDRKRFEGQLQHLADHDALTGMFNRRRFEEELDRELARSVRYGTGGAVLALDIDHFKYVNDTLGHSAGDELITRAGEIFRSRLRETDIIARLGGDEFSVILPEAGVDEALKVADSLLEALREEGRLTFDNGQLRRVTASIGVASFRGAVSAEEMLVEADIAMYDAKEAGRDRVEVYDANQDRQQRMQAGLVWADRIRDALEDEQFILHAQPILALADDDVPRVELLIRMLGDGGDLVPPGTFLSAAERFGLIGSIDRWVLRQAIALLATEKRAGRPIELAVNLSAKSVVDPELPEFVAAELRAAGIDGHGLCVEITETAAIVNVDRARQCAQLLGELGCQFALDDFGAGFASFYYLKHLAFDYVKIDGEFIRNLPESHINQLVVQSLVEIAQGLGKKTIAEFVGDAETLELLRRYGVDYAQGFFISKPQPLEELGLGRPAAPADWRAAA